jgi:PAS domain S-box-containing protein
MEPIHHELVRYCEQFGPLLDRLSCGFVARDAGGTIRLVNERALGWLGYEENEIVGRPVEDLAPRELHDAMADEREAIDGGDLRSRLFVLRRKDGSVLPIVTLPHQAITVDGRYLGAYSFLIELSAIQTARPLGEAAELRGTLNRIALELQALSQRPDLADSTDAAWQTDPAFAPLSTREREVLALLAQAARVPAIATHLHISQNTVRNHLKAIFAKLGVRSQSALIERVHAAGRR